MNRSTVYAPQMAAKQDAQTLERLALSDAAFTRHPCFGSRTIRQYLRGVGDTIHRKRVQRLMGVLGLAGRAPGPNTSRPHPQHTVYPYWLRGVVVTRPNQVWSTDSTDIRLARGVVYLGAVLDGYSRTVLSWRVSNTRESGCGMDCLEQAVQAVGTPEIVNTDQGCPFTREACTGVLTAHGIAISMEGRGRALENIFVERLWRSVTHDDVYVNGYATMSELLMGLTEYFVLYNTERPHHSMRDGTPDEAYRTASGGGARIMDKYREPEKTSLEIETQKETESRGSAVPLHVKGDPLTLDALLS